MANWIIVNMTPEDLPELLDLDTMNTVYPYSYKANGTNCVDIIFNSPSSEETVTRITYRGEEAKKLARSYMERLIKVVNALIV
jgi:hypothetical protein